MKQLQDFAQATDDSNEKGRQARQVYLDQAAALEKLAGEIEKIRPELATLQAKRSIGIETGDMNQRTSLLNSGASQSQLDYQQKTSGG